MALARSSTFPLPQRIHRTPGALYGGIAVGMLASCHFGRDPDAPGTSSSRAGDSAHRSADPASDGDADLVAAATSPQPPATPSNAEREDTKAIEETAPRAKFARPAEWPSDVVFPLHNDPTWLRPVRGDAGDLRVELALEQRDLEGPLADWRAALAEAGYVERAACEIAETHARCDFIGPDRLGVLRVSRPAMDPERVYTSLHLYPVGHTPTTKLPGACVVPPEVSRRFEADVDGIDQEGESFSARLGYVLSAWDASDLDGDGVLDRFVPRPKGGRCPWEVTFDVYVMRGECGHLVGGVTGDFDQETHVARFVRGLRSITTRSEWATLGGDHPLPQHHTRTRRYEFDGKHLRERSDETRTGDCHHCGVTHCRELPMGAG